MRPSDPHACFEQVVAGLKNAGGRLLSTMVHTPVGVEWHVWLVGSRVIALVIFERDPRDLARVRDFDVMTGVGGEMDPAEIGKRLDACFAGDRAALAADMGLVPVIPVPARADGEPAIGGGHNGHPAPGLFKGDQPNQSQGSPPQSPAPAAKRSRGSRTAPAGAMSST